MANRRNFSWPAVIRDLKDDRARRAGIREERLRATAGLKQALPLSSWRGRSGRRYVVGVHALCETDLDEVTDAVIIAVARGQDGSAHVVDVATAGASPPRRQRRQWMSRARERGATELHVHRLAETDDERRAIVDDLQEASASPS